jgi:hypothetical protein
VNESPVIGDFIRSVRENSEVGTLVGDPITATDVDENDKLSFEIISGSTSVLQDGTEVSDVFLINPVDGNIYVNKAVLNYEWQPEFKLSVKALDLKGLYDVGIVTLNLDNANDGPVLKSQERDVNENSPDGSLIGTAVRAFDEDALDVLEYYLTGSNCWSKTLNAVEADSYSTFPPPIVESGNVNMRVDLRRSRGGAVIVMSVDELNDVAAFDGLKIHLGVGIHGDLG